MIASPKLAAPPVPSHPAVTSIVAPPPPLLVRCWQWTKGALLISWRVVYLGFTFCWPLLTAPLAYLGPATLRRYWWGWLRNSIVRSGPCATKLAQWIATRPDLFSAALVDELACLQSLSAEHTVIETGEALDLAFGETWRAELSLEAGPDRAIGSGCVASVFR